MRQFFFKIFSLIFLSIFTLSSFSQVYDPVKWKFETKKVSETEYDLIFTATIEDHWHLYSQFLDNNDGPIATSFNFDENKDCECIGKVKEGKPKVEFDPNFEMDLKFFEKKAVFTQRVKKKTDAKTAMKGWLEFMVCNETMCLPPEQIDFKFDLPGTEPETSPEKIDTSGDVKATIDCTNAAINLDTNNVDTAIAVKSSSSIVPELPNVDLENPIGNCGNKSESRDIWIVFFLGFFGGLLALLTPCVFPMIPLTVSFFTKDGGGSGFGKAVLYGFFIFMIYASLSIPFHFNADPEVLSEIATSVWLNVLFFAVFMFFAFSFFGFYEITLPSSLANKTDSASNVGGIAGIFFMALTLALVSFSCTGPILGSVLGSSLKNGPWPITAAMSGFGIALGLPFALFAAFPSMMKKLPQSGGWLNSVKVVLGFIELALALKFISNADLVEQWGLIKRETFFLIWTIIGLGTTLYLLGVIKFPHDSPINGFSKTRIFFITIFGAFTIYIAPGVLKNTPWTHDLLSGFPPPTFYSWYEKETFHAEFDDFDLALQKAKETNKPILIDFTGWACVNCRKMEETVWTVESIKKILEEDFILVSLYVDDKVELPKELQGEFTYTVDGVTKTKKIRTIGNKWATFQTQVFNNNSQPYYVMLSHDGYLLGNPVGYTPDEEEYEDYLKCGLKAFKEHINR